MYSKHINVGVCVCVFLSQDLLKAHGSVQATLQQLTDVEKQLRLQVEPSSIATFQTDYLSLSRRLATVGHTLHRQQALMEVVWLLSNKIVVYFKVLYLYIT